MHPNRWRRISGLVVIAIALIVGTMRAGAAEPSPADAKSPSATISATQAHDLVTLLNDPARRNQLIGELQALEKLAPANSGSCSRRSGAGKACSVPHALGRRGPRRHLVRTALAARSGVA